MNAGSKRNAPARFLWTMTASILDDELIIYFQFRPIVRLAAARQVGEVMPAKAGSRQRQPADRCAAGGDENPDGYRQEPLHSVTIRRSRKLD